MIKKEALKYAHHPDDYKYYTTKRLRSEFLVQEIFLPDQVSLCYSHYDRLIIGGIMPVDEKLELTAMKIQKTKHFCDRREAGIINIGGPGTVIIDGTEYELGTKEAAYTGKGTRSITAISKEKENPAKFYLNSAPAHISYPTAKITRSETIAQYLGDEDHSNKRILYQYLTPNTIQCCQLMMGITEVAENNVWNTMPCHTHELRMEAYMYFDINHDETIGHVMGPKNETRLLWVHNEEVVLSPPWSLHTASGTTNYSFIWGMSGFDSEMDFIAKNELM
jgi:4-deoxy-L-threo-5-hexosulose-uronate ketol-isomerase